MAPKDERKSKGKNEAEVDELVANINQGSKQKNRKKRKKSQNSPEGEKSGQSEKRQTLQRTIQGVETLPVTNQCYNNSVNPSIQSYSQCSNNMSQQQFYSSQGQMMNGGQLPYQGQGFVLPDAQPLSQILTSRLDSIDNKLMSLDSINQQLSVINGKISNLQIRVVENEKTVKNLQKTVSDLEESKNFDSSSITSLNESQKRIDSSHSKILNDLKQTQDQNAKMAEQLIDLKGRSMRDNLLFFGFPESRHNQRNEPCVSKIFDFCEIELGLTDVRETVKIDRAHRIGPPKPSKTRPIVAKFNYYRDKETIKRAAGEKLTNSKFSVGDQFPKEIQQRRRKLVPILKKAQSEGKDAILIYDKLYINGVKFVENGQTDQQRHRRGSSSDQPTQQSVRDDRPPHITDLRGKRNPLLANKFTYLSNMADSSDVSTSASPSISGTDNSEPPSTYTSALKAVLETMLATDDNNSAQSDMELGAVGGTDDTVTPTPASATDRSDTGARPKTASQA